MEFAAANTWNQVWLKSDSWSIVQAFKNSHIVPFHLRIRWHNCLHLGIEAICSHIFCEGNCCADKLATYGHSVTCIVWLTSLPQTLMEDFTRDRNGLPNFRFP